MFINLIITSLFFLSVVAQTSLIQSGPVNFIFFPLHLIIGLLVFHRYSPPVGSLWFLLTIPLAIWGFQPGSAWSYLSIALVGLILVNRLFTTRSVYALLGLGLTMSLLYLVINLSLGALHLNLTQIIIFVFEILFGLFIGNLISSYWQKFSSRWIYIRGV